MWYVYLSHAMEGFIVKEKKIAFSLKYVYLIAIESLKVYNGKVVHLTKNEMA